MICVYKILSPDKQKCYVGSTKDYKQRVCRHKTISNNCMSKLLFEEFGFDNCEFVVVEQCLEEELETKEQWWMEHSYNMVNKYRAVFDKQKKAIYNAKYKEEHKEQIAIQKAKYYQEKIKNLHKM